MAGGRGARVAPAHGPRRERDHVGDTAVTVFSVVPEYGDPPDATLVTADLRRMLEGRLDVEDRLERRARAARPHGANAPPPKVALVDNASNIATVVEVRAHDEPGRCGASAGPSVSAA